MKLEIKKLYEMSGAGSGDSDEIKNMSTVLSALDTYGTEMANLQKYIGRLEANKGKLSNAWKSANASSFTSGYTDIINNINNAYEDLDEYRKKILSVVEQFTAFDQAVSIHAGKAED